MAEATIISPPKQDGPLVHDENGDVSLEQLQELLQGEGAPDPEERTELERAVCGPVEEVSIPIRIELEDGNEFCVDDMHAWAWTPFGLYAVGHWASDEEGEFESNQVFAGRTIKRIELQAEAYAEYVQLRMDVEGAGEGSSD